MIDTHSHLFVEEFDEDLPAVIERARDSGVSKVFMPNIDDTTVEAMLNVCTAYKGYCLPMDFIRLLLGLIRYSVFMR